MILVAVGTQDRPFNRLLNYIKQLKEEGIIKDKLIVQKGCGDFECEEAEVFEMLTEEEFTEYVKEARIVICHGGVGIIHEAVEYDKPVIAVARLKEYGEHQNDHQKQIINEFYKRGYLLKADNLEDIPELLKEAETFKPNKFESNKDNFNNLIFSLINKENKHNKYLRIKLFFSLTGFLLQVLFYKMNPVLLSSYIFALILALVIELIFFRDNTGKRYLLFILSLVCAFLFVYFTNLGNLITFFISWLVVLF